ncbi:MAG: glycoside hydrolase family 2 protein, partial [Treponema sp.]|nr:glycoside hydrolase family 2 protein [Treponema sp.]
MIIQKLHSNWKMRVIAPAGRKNTGWLDAKVPGSVYNDLLAGKKMPDPFWRDNEDGALALMENNFEYECVFTVTRALLKADRVVLRCEGLDTLAELSLNGLPVGRADNMHRVWEFDVRDKLKKTDNTLRVLFYSPVKFIREAYKKTRADGSSDCLDGFPLLRKAHCMFGWDWGPRLPDAGIWRDIKLCGIKTARIESVFITQKHRAGAVELGIRTDVEKARPAETAYSVIVTDPGGKSRQYDNSPTAITIGKPELWWPNGYGDQPLYTVKVALLRGNAVIDTWERRIGLRSMTVRIKKDKWGESFAHEVNGVRIFAMGADYIPEDSILPRVTEKRTRKLLEQCVAANFNVIRVWGGGYYPGDSFFDACDELGLVVWQDFMFACAVYDLSEEFEENIRAELIDNIKRIRHHAS